MSDSKAQDRPLSPHLQVYRWEWTMLYSILHRMTGVGLAVGTTVLVWWLVAMAIGPGAFDLVQSFLGSIIGRLMLFGWTWALFYHLANGIRHLFWDAGMGFELETGRLTGHTVLASSVVLTVLAWVCGYAALG